MITTGWKNKKGTGDRTCRCGSWKQHWLNYSHHPWPKYCSVRGCFNAPTLGAHVINPRIAGEMIIPMCDACNRKSESFDLVPTVEPVSANQASTCAK